MKFAYINEQDSLYLLSSEELSGAGLPIRAMDGARYIFTERGDQQVAETVAATRTGDDLRLAFASDSSAASNVVIQDFFLNRGSLHGLSEDGQYRVHLVADSNTEQGPIVLATENLGAQEDQADAGFLKVVQRAATIEAVEQQLFSLNSANDAAIAAQQEAASFGPVNLMADDAGVLADDAPQITAIYDNVGKQTGAIQLDPQQGISIIDDKSPVIEGSGRPNSTLHLMQNGVRILTVEVNAEGHWSVELPVPLTEGAQFFSVIDAATEQMSNTVAVIVDTIAPAQATIDQIVQDNTGETLYLNKGDHTGDNTPLLSGKADASTLVTIFNGTVEIGATISNAQGEWSYSRANPPLPDGVYNFRVQSQDSSGNIGLPSRVFTITIDTLPPAQPVIVEVWDDAGASVGAIPSGATTDDATPTLRGTAEARATIQVLDGGRVIGTTVADANGNWAFTPAVELDTGLHVFTVIAVDGVGNASVSSLPWNVTIAVGVPAVPVVEQVQDDHGPVIGAVANGGFTDDNTPTFKGQADVGTTVRVFNNGVLLGTAQVDADGNWEFTPAALADGQYTLTFQSVNGAGNQSDMSQPWVVNVDTVKPDLPTIGGVLDDVGAITGALVSGAHTDDARPTFSGTGEAGATAIIRDGLTEIGRAPIDQDGNWVFTPSTDLADGDHSINVIVQDSAGNQSEASNAWDLTVDTEQPGKPTIGGAQDNVGVITGALESGDMTDDARPTFSGTGEAGSTVIIRDGDEEIGRVQVDGSGEWTYTPADALEDGEHSITVVVQDQAGNTSDPSDAWVVNVDTSKPGQPTIDGVQDDVGDITGALVSGAYTDDARPTFSGTGEAGSTVIIRDGTEEIGRVQVDGSGEWTYTPADALEDGEHAISVVVRDQAGNTSDPSEAWVVNVDTSKPGQPTIDGVQDDVGAITGALVSGAYTDDARPTFSGTGEAGATAIIRDGLTEIGRATIDQDGNWVFTPGADLADGDHSINVIVRDQAGNQSDASDAWALTVDTIKPGLPTIAGVYDDVGDVTGALVSGAFTDDTKPTLSGTAEAGSTIIIFDDGNEIGRASVDGTGQWTYTPEDDLGQGEHSFSVIAVDRAGNASDESTAWVTNIVSHQPSKPTIDGIEDDVGAKIGALHPGDVTDDTQPTISGRSDAGSTVYVYNHGQEIGSVLADEDGNWTYTPTVALGDDTYSFSAIAVNGAGTRSPESDPFDLVIYTGTGPDKVAYLSHMGKDSGYDGNDFVTDNGSAGRLMYGLLSAELTGSEQLQVSTDGGRTWVQAQTDGLNWAAQDNNSHLANWNIQTRVVAGSGGNAGFVMEQAVVLDLIAPRAPVSVALDGTHLTVGLVSENLVVGDRVSVVADGGLHRFEYTLTQHDITAGSVTLDVGNVSSASAALVDHAGNLSAYVNTGGVPSVNIMVTGDVSEIYGQARDNVFSIDDVSILDRISVIEGNGGVDTLRLLGADQTLDLSAITGRLSSIEVIDLTGSGNNTLKVSLGDVLDIGNRGSFINNSAVQLAVKGNAGDMVVLSDLLPNGMDTGDWENLGQVTSAGIVYDVYQHSNFGAELLVQQGVGVQM